jgi:hypothetical protein
MNSFVNSVTVGPSTGAFPCHSGGSSLQPASFFPPQFVPQGNFVLGSLDQGTMAHGVDPNRRECPAEFHQLAQQRAAGVPTSHPLQTPTTTYVQYCEPQQLIPIYQTSSGDWAVSLPQSPVLMPQPPMTPVMTPGSGMYVVPQMVPNVFPMPVASAAPTPLSTPSPQNSNVFVGPPSAFVPSYLTGESTQFPNVCKGDPTLNQDHFQGSSSRQEMINSMQQVDVQLPHEAMSELESHREQTHDEFDQNRFQSLWILFVERTDNVLDSAMRNAKRTKRRWYKREKNAVEALKENFRQDFEFWKNEDPDLLPIFINVVHHAADLIKHDSESSKHPNCRQIQQICQKLPLVLKYLKQNDFNAEGAVTWLMKFEKSRSLLIYIRAFKNLQLMNFENFHLTLSKNKNEALENHERGEEKDLRGDNCIRFRAKRVDCFREEAHLFDGHVRELIALGEVEVDGIYICFDHKPKKKKSPNKGIVSGILFYFVTPSADAAENLLRKLVQFCEDRNSPFFEINQKMFRKKESKTMENQFMPQRLCEVENWTEDDFQRQKEMYHFTLAKTKAESTPPPAEITTESTQPPLVKMESPYNYAG